MQCERLGAYIISMTSKNMVLNKIMALVALGEFTVEGFYFLARVKCRANFGRVGNLICRPNSATLCRHMLRKSRIGNFGRATSAAANCAK
jgi:hypothetical protein